MSNYSVAIFPMFLFGVVVGTLVEANLATDYECNRIAHTLGYQSILIGSKPAFLTKTGEVIYINGN